MINWLVKLNNKLSVLSKLIRGVKQGGVVSGTLFNLFIDWLMSLLMLMLNTVYGVLSKETEWVNAKTLYENYWEELSACLGIFKLKKCTVLLFSKISIWFRIFAEIQAIFSFRWH